MGRPLAGQRIDAAALDGGLTNRILVAEGIEIAWLCAELLRHQHGDLANPRYCCCAASIVSRQVCSESLTSTPM
jgi:hypothetical protein